MSNSLTTQRFVASHTKTFSHVSELLHNGKMKRFPSFECENDPRKPKFYLEFHPGKKGTVQTSFWVALCTDDNAVFASTARIELRKSVSQRKIAVGYNSYENGQRWSKAFHFFKFPVDGNNQYEFYVEIAYGGAHMISEMDTNNTNALIAADWSATFDSQSGVDVKFIIGGEEDDDEFHGENHDADSAARPPVNATDDSSRGIKRSDHGDQNPRRVVSIISAHRLVLTTRSPVFRAMFAHDMIENQTKEVPIRDIRVAVFTHFLRFLYCGDIPADGDQSFVMDLLTTAGKYQVADLKSRCETKMKQFMDAKTVADILVFSHHHDFLDLQSSCLGWIRCNFELFDARKENWDLLKGYPTLLVEVCRARYANASESDSEGGSGSSSGRTN